MTLPSRAACMLITHVHMIISMEEGLIQWFKLEQPEFNLNDKEGADQKLRILDEVE